MGLDINTLTPALIKAKNVATEEYVDTAKTQLETQINNLTKVEDISWQSEVQDAINNNATTIDGGKIVTNTALVNNLNATGGIKADSVTVNTALVNSLNAVGGITADTINTNTIIAPYYDAEKGLLLKNKFGKICLPLVYYEASSGSYGASAAVRSVGAVYYGVNIDEGGTIFRKRMAKSSVYFNYYVSSVGRTTDYTVIVKYNINGGSYIETLNLNKYVASGDFVVSGGTISLTSIPDTASQIIVTIRATCSYIKATFLLNNMTGSTL